MGLDLYVATSKLEPETLTKEIDKIQKEHNSTGKLYSLSHILEEVWYGRKTWEIYTKLSPNLERGWCHVPYSIIPELKKMHTLASLEPDSPLLMYDNYELNALEELIKVLDSYKDSNKFIYIYGSY